MPALAEAHAHVQTPLGARLYTFVVVADTHVNQTEVASTSPFRTNALANGRARRVFRDIARMQPAPAFGIHLGDMVHPLPSLPSFAEAVSCYRALVDEARVPFHAVPGNHDIGDKNVSWMPADKVCDRYLQIYREAFGPDRYGFDHEGLRLLVVNALLLNSGLPDEALQAAWLEQELASAEGRRVMVFMHYPPYICDPSERNHYDNVDEPARGWLLELLRRPQVEAVFAGHTHNFWYDRIGHAEFYTLPSTAFVRHDFSEFCRVAPGDEFGRNDTGKFGYMRVDVHERGHVAYLVRSHGVSDSASDDGTAAAAMPAHDLLAHPKASTLSHLGVELRHPWSERMQIASTGGVQEFGRKWARNDYPMLALFEMGNRLSKVPELDLQETDASSRMRLLARVGQRFVVTTLGMPTIDGDAAALQAAGVAAFEVNTSDEELQRHTGRLKALREASGVDIYYARLRTDPHANYDGQQFSHVVKSGCTLDEMPGLLEWAIAAREAGALDGLTVRIEPTEPLLDAACRLERFAQDSGCAVLASLKLEGPSLARERVEDRENVLRVAQAALLSRTSDRVLYIFDTFMDVDRGYFPRTAFIDRRFNPRPPAVAFAMLSALLAEQGTAPFRVESHDDSKLTVRQGAAGYALLWGHADALRDQLGAFNANTLLCDLVSARRQSISDWQCDGRSAAPDPALHVVLIPLR